MRPFCAGSENRTRVSCLGSKCSTTEPYPRMLCKSWCRGLGSLPRMLCGAKLFGAAILPLNYTRDKMNLTSFSTFFSTKTPLFRKIAGKGLEMFTLPPLTIRAGLLRKVLLRELVHHYTVLPKSKRNKY